MATVNTLTDKAIRAGLKAAKDEGKPIRLSDGDGLRIDLQPTGSGWWRLRYHFGGKEGMLSLGTYPEVALAQARQRRDDSRKQIAAGVDPSAQRRADKAVKAAQVQNAKLLAAGGPVPGSFEAVAREWLSTVHEARVTEGHAARTRVRLEQNVFPWLPEATVGASCSPLSRRGRVA